MSEPLLLVAASGLAREVLAAVRTRGAFDVVGFLDDSAALQGTTIDGLPVLGPIDAIVDHPWTQVLVCAGRGAAREGIVARLDPLEVSPARYATFVHPSVEVPAGCVVGAGSIVLAGVVMTASVELGEHVVVMPNATLTHDDVLQDFATICAGVALGGGVVVGRGAYVGMNASVRERTVIGAGATLGMGAVLLNDLPAGQTWAGVPARTLPANDEQKVDVR
jgi:sugar O-acyltransferase (sialic acid O-acetyltransferase NeuD family)